MMMESGIKDGKIDMSYALGILGYILAILVPFEAWINHIIY